MVNQNVFNVISFEVQLVLHSMRAPCGWCIAVKGVLFEHLLGEIFKNNTFIH